MRLLITTLAATAALVAATVVPNANTILACAGLIGSNGAVNLARTSTLAAYVEDADGEGGVEHYITAFKFQGGGGEFGSLIPLPAVPTKVERGGAWTLQRLEIETAPPQAALSETAAFDGAARLAGPEVLQEVRIDALDISVLKGGGADVAVWAQEHGFRLSPDAPEVLDFYAKRSPIFLAAVFDGDAAVARGQQLGDGTPVHITMPTDNPWVPLRILGLGKQPAEIVEADVYLLTDKQPSLLPLGRDGIDLTHSAAANDFLLEDLRSDEGMGWVPESGWLSKLSINSRAEDLNYDLAIDANGDARPSLVDAGLRLPNIGDSESVPSSVIVAIAATVAAAFVTVVALRLDARKVAS